MSDFHLNIIACGGCDYRHRPCAGPCPCLVDRVDSHAHARAGYCPHPDGPRFGSGEKPAGWPFTLPVASEEEIAAAFERDRRAGPCCGG